MQESYICATIRPIYLSRGFLSRTREASLHQKLVIFAIVLRSRDRKSMQNARVRFRAEKGMEILFGEGLYLNTAKCRVMDHCQRARLSAEIATILLDKDHSNALRRVIWP